MRVLNIFKKAFASLEIEFLTIQLIIPYNRQNMIFSIKCIIKANS